MEFLTVRDLRSRPGRIRQALQEDREIVLTANGKPFAILAAATEENLEESLAMIRRIRAENAVLAMQRRSVETGRDRFTLKEINAEISAARKARP